MPPRPLIQRQVEEMVAKGQPEAAVDLLERESTNGDPDALFVFGIWLDSGQHIPQDRTRARACFERAANAGHVQADTILTNFLGNGTGGPRDWPAAMARLRTKAQKNARASAELALIEKMSLTASGEPRSLPLGKQLSEEPWVVQHAELFTNEECAYLTAAAAPYLQPATVIDNVSGKAIRNPIRTSHTAVLNPPLENPVVHALNRRLAAVTRTNVGQGEPLQVLRYLRGQEYKPHIDAIPSLENQRILTALVYLNEAYEGGETRFVSAGTSFRGRTGCCLVFRNVDREGRPDKQAAHCGMPVTSGVKLLASRWIREREFIAT